MNKVANDIYDILKQELSEITSKMILEDKCLKIGKSPENITQEDIQILMPLILSPVLLFGGEKKAKAVREKLDLISERL